VNPGNSPDGKPGRVTVFFAILITFAGFVGFALKLYEGGMGTLIWFIICAMAVITFFWFVDILFKPRNRK
jgi:hypothetical protein